MERETRNSMIAFKLIAHIADAQRTTKSKAVHVSTFDSNNYHDGIVVEIVLTSLSSFRACGDNLTFFE